MIPDVWYIDLNFLAYIYIFYTNILLYERINERYIVKRFEREPFTDSHSEISLMKQFIERGHWENQ